MDYYINLAETAYQPGSVEQKHYLSAEVCPLGFISDPLEQDHYIMQISRQLRNFGKGHPPANKTGAGNHRSRRAPQASGNLLLEKEVLGGMLMFPECFRQKPK